MLADWEIERLREESARESARLPSTAGRLWAAASATPTPEQQAVFEECVRLARADGLELPIVEVFWKDGPDDVAPGAVRRQDEDGEISISIALSVYGPNLQETIFHELKHCADLASDDDYSREELEVRAVRFAHRMMQSALDAWL